MIEIGSMVILIVLIGLIYAAVRIYRRASKQTVKSNQSLTPTFIELKVQSKAQTASIQPPLAYARLLELNRLDAEIAVCFKFYSFVTSYDASLKRPTGIPKEYDNPRPPDERDRKSIPRYSTDEKAFSRLYSRGEAFGILDL